MWRPHTVATLADAPLTPLLQDCEEGLLLGWMLTKNWDEMAKHFVDLNGKMTHEEKKELILSRLRPTLSRVRARRNGYTFSTFLRSMFKDHD